MPKKKIKKTKADKVIESLPVPTPVSQEIPTIATIGKLSVSFPNEDLNRLVEKINEIIEKI